MSNPQPQTIKSHELLLEKQQKELGVTDPITLETASDLILTYMAESMLDRAEPLLRETLAHQRAQHGADSGLALLSQALLGTMCAELGKLDEALVHQEAALATRLQVFGAEHPDTVITMIDLAITHTQARDLEAAGALLKRALPLATKVLGPGHTHTTLAVDLSETVFKNLDDGYGHKVKKYYRDQLTDAERKEQAAQKRAKRKAMRKRGKR